MNQQGKNNPSYFCRFRSRTPILIPKIMLSKKKNNAWSRRESGALVYDAMKVMRHRIMRPVIDLRKPSRLVKCTKKIW